MKKLTLLVSAVLLSSFFGCDSSTSPDVSHSTTVQEIIAEQSDNQATGHVGIPNTIMLPGDIRNYGALSGGNEATNLSAIQNAINAAPSTGGEVFIPAGIWTINGALTISKGLKIRGVGNKSIIISSNGKAHILSIATTEAVYIEDLLVVYQEWATPSLGSSCIYVTDADGSSANYGSRFTNLSLGNGSNDIWFYRAAYFSVTNCALDNAYANGMLVENNHNSDEGDSVVQGCVFSGRPGSNAGIEYDSSGGLKIVGNKFLGFFNYNINMNAREHSGSGGLNSWVIASNSIEGAMLWGIRIADNGSNPNTGTIVGNEIPTGIYLNGSGPANLSGIVISGNNFHVGSPAGNTASVLVSNASYVTITGNLFRAAADPIKGTQISNGVKISPASNNIVVTGNLYRDFPPGSEISGSYVTPIDVSQMNGSLKVNNGSLSVGTGSKSTTQQTAVLSSQDTANPMQMIFRRNTNMSWQIQSVEQNVAWRDLLLNPNGGNVYINTFGPISVGAADSGGKGYRTLIVPNN